MKLIVNRGSLLEALDSTAGVIASRTPKPILQCVKFSANPDNTIEVGATDLETTVRRVISVAQVDAPGVCAIPHDKLRDIVRNSNDDTISLELEKDTLHVRTNDAHYKIYTQDAKDYPPLTFDGEVAFSVGGAVLAKLLAQSTFCAAKESTRYAFNGVLLILEKKKLTAVATDGRRLACVHAPVDAAGAFKHILPNKALAVLAKTIDPEEAIEISARESEGRVSFKCGETTIVTNTVEGQFPPYEDVIPKECDKKMTAGTEALLSAVRRAALLTTEESKGVRLAFSKKGLKLTSRSPEAGEAEVNFACKYEGPDVEIGFNPTFINEALRVADGDEVTLELTAPNRPGLIRQGNYSSVVMPVNLA